MLMGLASLGRTGDNTLTPFLDEREIFFHALRGGAALNPCHADETIMLSRLCRNKRDGAVSPPPPPPPLLIFRPA